MNNPSIANTIVLEYKDGEHWFAVTCPHCGHKNGGWVLQQGESPAGCADECDNCRETYYISIDPDFIAERVS